MGTERIHLDSNRQEINTMTTKNAVKNVAKGLALGILWPAAVGFIAGHKAGNFLTELSHDSLDTARDWIDSAEQGLVEAAVQAKGWFNPPIKKPAVSVRARVQPARSVGAAAATDANVSGQSTWVKQATKFYQDWWDGKLSPWLYLSMAALILCTCIAIKLSVTTALIGMAAALGPLMWASSQMETA
jgi:hypothetical protein